MKYVSMNDLTGSVQDLSAAGFRLLWLMATDSQKDIAVEYGNPEIHELYVNELEAAGYIEDGALNLDIVEK